MLEDGLDALALRGLAARLSTSGRMLLYHFGSKDRLVRAALASVSARMAVVLREAASARPAGGAGALFAALVAASVDPATAPFMRVWTDVVARAARGEEPYRGIAVDGVGGWLDWIAGRLSPGPDNEAMAAAMLSIVEGITLLELARPGTTAGARRLLPMLLDRAASGDGG